MSHSQRKIRRKRRKGLINKFKYNHFYIVCVNPLYFQGIIRIHRVEEWTEKNLLTG